MQLVLQLRRILQNLWLIILLCLCFTLHLNECSDVLLRRDGSSLARLTAAICMLAMKMSLSACNHNLFLQGTVACSYYCAVHIELDHMCAATVHNQTAIAIAILHQPTYICMHMYALSGGPAVAGSGWPQRAVSVAAISRTECVNESKTSSP